MGIEGEDDPRVIAGVNFLKEVNLGVGKTLNRNVVIVGGGNVAIDVARTALRQGATNVNLDCLEQRNEIPSANEEISEAEIEGIKIHNGWGLKRISSETITFIKCLHIKNDSGKFNRSYDENDTIDVKSDYILLAIGQAFDYKNIFDGSNVELSKRQTVLADKLTKQSSEPDIFVGGDILNSPNFCITAIVDGKQAAISLHRYVQPGQSLDIGRDRRLYSQIDIDNVNFNGYDSAPRQIPQADPVDTKSYKDNRGFFI